MLFQYYTRQTDSYSFRQNCGKDGGSDFVRSGNSSSNSNSNGSNGSYTMWARFNDFHFSRRFLLGLNLFYIVSAAQRGISKQTVGVKKKYNLKKKKKGFLFLGIQGTLDLGRKKQKNIKVFKGPLPVVSAVQ